MYCLEEKNKQGGTVIDSVSYTYLYINIYKQQMLNETLQSYYSIPVQMHIHVTHD